LSGIEQPVACRSFLWHKSCNLAPSVSLSSFNNRIPRRNDNAQVVVVEIVDGDCSRVIATRPRSGDGEAAGRVWSAVTVIDHAHDKARLLPGVR
jgi:hypothetical protein